jgi:hypothetical protein
VQLLEVPKLALNFYAVLKLVVLLVATEMVAEIMKI